MSRDSFDSDAGIVDKGDSDSDSAGYEGDISFEHSKSLFHKGSPLPQSYKEENDLLKLDLEAEQRTTHRLTVENNALKAENAELKRNVEALEQALQTVSKASSGLPKSSSGGTLKRRKKRKVSRRKN